MYRRQLSAIFNGETAYELPFYALMFIALLIMLAALKSTLLDQDEMIYAVIATQLLDGHLPYQETFDHKPVGIYYIYALFFTFFGENYVAIRLLAISMVVGTAITIFLALKSLGFSKPARITASALCVTFPLGLDGLSGNTEGVQIFLLSGLFFLATKIVYSASRLAAVIFGLVVAFGFSVNYLFSILALLAFLSILLHLYVEKTKLQSLLLYSVLTFSGFVLGNVLIFSPYLVDYLGGGDLLSQYFAEQQRFLTGYGVTSIDKRILIDKFFFWVIPFIPILVGGGLTFYQLNRAKWLAGYFAIGTFVSACIAASASLFFFNHYWILAAVPLSLLAAISCENAKTLQARHIFRYGLSFILLFYMLSGCGRIVNHLSNSGGERELKAANEFIKNTISEDDFIVSVSVSPVYTFLNKLNIDQQYLFQGHVEQLHDVKAIQGDDYFIDLLSRKPEYILVDPVFCVDRRKDIFKLTCKSIGEEYNLIESFAGIRPVSIYRRK